MECPFAEEVLNFRMFLDLSLKYVNFVMNYFDLIGVDYVELTNTIKNIKVAEWGQSNYYDELGNMYSEFSKMERSSMPVLIVLDNQRIVDMVKKNMSQTAVDEMMDCRLDAISSYDKFISYKGKINIMEDMIKNRPIDIPKLLEHIDKCDDNIDFLLANRIKFTLRSPTTTRGQHSLISGRLEAIKDKILSAERVQDIYLSRAQLIPSGHYLPASELDIRPDDCVISRNSKSNIEFSITELIDKNYVIDNKLITTGNMGICKSIITKYTTMRTLKDREVQSNYRVSGNINSTRIFETIDGGKTYRTLSPVTYDTHTSVKSIISGTTTRPMIYNRSHEKIILDKLFNPRILQLADEYNSTLTKTSTEGIKYTVTRYMTEHIGELVKSKFNDGIISDIESLKSVILDKSYLTYLLTESLGDYNNNKEEPRMAYIVKFSGLAKGFSSEFEKAIDTKKFNKDIFLSNKDWTLSGLLSFVSECLKSTISTMDESNTWNNYGMTLKEYVFKNYQ